MLAKFGQQLFLGSLGLTKNDVINVVLAALVRRVYVNGFNEGVKYEPPADEVKRILNDKDYRKMLSVVGRSIRSEYAKRSDVGELLFSALSEHSVSLRNLYDQLTYGSSGLVVDDDTVNLAIGEFVGYVKTATGLGLVGTDSALTPEVHAPATRIISDALKNVGSRMSKRDLFPDIHHYLTDVDSENPLLR